MQFIKKTVLFILVSILLFSAGSTAFAADSIQAGDILCFGEPDEASGFDGK